MSVSSANRIEKFQRFSHLLCIAYRYTVRMMAILSFRCKDTKALHERQAVLRLRGESWPCSTRQWSFVIS
jgi:hypothetical protein